MQRPSFKEDHISQIPALALLINMGYRYLSPSACLQARGGSHRTVLLENILAQQLKRLNKIERAGQQIDFSEANIGQAIRRLSSLPLAEGYITASQKLYDLLTAGISLEQSIAGQKKSYNLKYIDFEHPERNCFHLTEEYSVLRTGRRDHYRPDIVLFVNGIPLGIIECKRPDMKQPIAQAISQHLRNQQEDGIRNLYVYAQILLSISTNSGKYATNGTAEKFWSHWQEKFANAQAKQDYEQQLYALKNRPLSEATKNALFEERYRYVRQYFDALGAEPIAPSPQDAYLYGLFRPERLLDFVRNFILYDNGVKKLARYQQYFAVAKAMEQLRPIQAGKRSGGVIWHTQGSGKSLTMVLLAQAIVMDPQIKNPKIVLVTDRTDLDEQITKTFQKCGMPVENAKTGKQLVTLLEEDGDVVITTVINKFETAVKKMSQPLQSPNIFVLVDEGHRTQHGTFNVNMERVLPHACFIALTGTPLFKKDKNTLSKFGKLIDHYTVDQAVKDGAVVPLLYEGRHTAQTVNAAALDNFFSMIAEPLTEYERKDLKKKFSRADQLNKADQKVYAQAWDIAKHFEKNFQGTGFKGQLVAPNKETAIKYKEFLDATTLVSSEVVISAIDDREGEDSAYGASSGRLNSFWKRMMEEHGNASRYQKNIVNRYKNEEHPEIIIVVDKLLTGFDAPQNTVLYLTRNLRNHSLLQAIARVNRVHPDKDYGYIIDYYGVLGALDDALATYSSFDDFDPDDLKGTLTDIKEEIGKLPQRHTELWDIFKTVKNKRDAEAYQQLLADEAIRLSFYDKLRAYARTLKMALSSAAFHEEEPKKQLAQYKEDLAFFLKLRKAVLTRYSDQVDYKRYEGQIQKLIDQHISSSGVEQIVSMVDIFDTEAFQEEVEKTIGDRAKADKIASRTARHISERLEEDPAFYRKFSEMLEEAIRDFKEKRMTELQYLNKLKDLMQKVLNREDSSLPAALAGHSEAQAFYGLALEELGNLVPSELEAEKKQQLALAFALGSDQLIKDMIVVDWVQKQDVQGQMSISLSDIIIDSLEAEGLSPDFDQVYHLVDRIIANAKKRYKS